MTVPILSFDDIERLSARGLSLIPLRPNDKRPDIDSWAEYQRRYATGDELRAWFGNGERRNVGIVLGAISGVIVVESDTPEAEAWCQENLPYTPMMTRSARGFHRYYRIPVNTTLPAFIVISDQLKIELKRDGQYVVGPGSVHPSGHVYAEVEPWPASIEELPFFPPSVLKDRASSHKTSQPLPEVIPDGARNNTLFREGCRMRYLGFHEPEILAALMAINRTRCQPPETESVVRQIAASAARYEPGKDEQVTPQVALVNLKDVQAESVSWLWHPYIPLGKVTLIEGDPGIGKSYLSLALATSISLGKGLPGTDEGAPGTVLLLSAEDGLGDTIRPRLDAMGADVSRIFALDGAVSLNAEGRGIIEEQIVRTRPRAVFIDPFVAYIGAKVDLHKANETRTVLAAVAAIAARHACAFILIRHLTKGSRDKSIYRGLGSIDITAACRSVLLVGADADDLNKRALVQVKSNLAAFGPARGYVIRNGSFEWSAGVSDLTAQRILAAESDTGPKAEAIDFLRETLASGPVVSADVSKLARKHGISEMTLRRARQELKVIVKAIREKGVMKGWEWRLPFEPDPSLPDIGPDDPRF